MDTNSAPIVKFELINYAHCRYREPCHHFHTKRGCWRGNHCHYMHTKLICAAAAVREQSELSQRSEPCLYGQQQQQRERINQTTISAVPHFQNLDTITTKLSNIESILSTHSASIQSLQTDTNKIRNDVIMIINDDGDDIEESLPLSDSTASSNDGHWISATNKNKNKRKRKRKKKKQPKKQQTKKKQPKNNNNNNNNKKKQPSKNIMNDNDKKQQSKQQEFKQQQTQKKQPSNKTQHAITETKNAEEKEEDGQELVNMDKIAYHIRCSGEYYGFIGGKKRVLNCYGKEIEQFCDLNNLKNWNVQKSMQMIINEPELHPFKILCEIIEDMHVQHVQMAHRCNANVKQIYNYHKNDVDFL